MQNAVQLNVRIAADVGKIHRLATEVADENLNGMTEAALCYFYGSTTPSVLAMRKKAVDAAKQLEKGTPLPFDSRPPQRRVLAVSTATRALCCPV